MYPMGAPKRIGLILLILAISSRLVLAGSSPENGDDDDDEDEEEEEDNGIDDEAFVGAFVHKVEHFHKVNAKDLSEDDDEPGDLEHYKKEKKWKKWPKYPLFIIILGGFRWDYLDAHKQNLTSFNFLRRHGTFIPKVKPVFPPEDYPVWTSIATGQYPDLHNINGDIMFNLRTRSFFDRSDPNSTEKEEWWQEVTPFWSLAAKHGHRIAMFNWHDCHLPGKQLERPEDCITYERQGVQMKADIAKQLDTGFTRLYKEDYDLAIIYTDIIRRVSELHGPLSAQVNRVLHDIDDLLQATLIDIIAKDERAGIKMNVLVLSDYGMSDNSELKPVYLDDYLELDLIQYVILSSGYAAIIPYVLEHPKILQRLVDLDGEGLNVYMASQLQDPPIEYINLFPDYLHYRGGEFVQDILLIAKPAYQLVVNMTDPKIICVPEGGRIDDNIRARSGFNPYFVEPEYPKLKIVKRKKLTPEQIIAIERWEEYNKHKDDMKVVSFAMGPDFKRNFVTYEEVEIVDWYQIICFLLKISPEEHSGNWERISNMMTFSRATTTATSSSIPCCMLYFLLSVAAAANQYF